MNLPLNIDIQQIFLHLFNFVLLFAILYFLLYKPVKDFIDKRKKTISDILDETEANHCKSEALIAEYNEKIAKADEDIANRNLTADNESLEKREEILKAAHDEADSIIKEAKARADAEHDKMLAETRNEITALISDAAGKVMAGSSVDESYDAFLDAAERNK